MLAPVCELTESTEHNHLKKWKNILGVISAERLKEEWSEKAGYQNYLLQARVFERCPQEVLPYFCAQNVP